LCHLDGWPAADYLDPICSLACGRPVDIFLVRKKAQQAGPKQSKADSG